METFPPKNETRKKNELCFKWLSIFILLHTYFNSSFWYIQQNATTLQSNNLYTDDPL